MFASCFRTLSGCLDDAGNARPSVRNDDRGVGTTVSSTRSDEDAFHETYSQTTAMKYERVKNESCGRPMPVPRRIFSEPDLRLKNAERNDSLQEYTLYGSLPINTSSMLLPSTNRTVLENKTKKQNLFIQPETDEIFQFDEDESVFDKKSSLENHSLPLIGSKKTEVKSLLSESEQAILKSLIEECHAKVDAAKNKVASIQDFWHKAFPGLKYLKIDVPASKSKQMKATGKIPRYKYKSKKQSQKKLQKAREALCKEIKIRQKEGYRKRLPSEFMLSTPRSIED